MQVRVKGVTQIRVYKLFLQLLSFLSFHGSRPCIIFVCVLHFHSSKLSPWYIIHTLPLSHFPVTLRKEPPAPDLKYANISGARRQAQRKYRRKGMTCRCWSAPDQTGTFGGGQNPQLFSAN